MARTLTILGLTGPAPALSAIEQLVRLIKAGTPAARDALAAELVRP